MGKKTEDGASLSGRAVTLRLTPKNAEMTETIRRHLALMTIGVEVPVLRVIEQAVSLGLTEILSRYEKGTKKPNEERCMDACEKIGLAIRACGAK